MAHADECISGEGKWRQRLEAVQAVLHPGTFVSGAAKNLVRKEKDPEKVGGRKALGRQYFRRSEQTAV